MKNRKPESYVKNTDEEMYEEVSFEEEKVLKARRESLAKKKPTSIALDESTIEELKKLAKHKGIPYQVLMRSYILEGLRKDRDVV